jgi:enoyl-[acyl-carrier-protein] reductase (NADH)
LKDELAIGSRSNRSYGFRIAIRLRDARASLVQGDWVDKGKPEATRRRKATGLIQPT